MMLVLRSLLNPQCQDLSFLNADKDIFKLHPITVSVKPWKGRHRVYGIFRIPRAHEIGYPILITVRGAGCYRKEASMVKHQVAPYADDQHYFLQVHLKTRVAISLILRGQFYQLKEPFNWMITYNTLS